MKRWQGFDWYGAAIIAFLALWLAYLLYSAVADFPARPAPPEDPAILQAERERLHPGR